MTYRITSPRLASLVGALHSPRFRLLLLSILSLINSPFSILHEVLALLSL